MASGEPLPTTRPAQPFQFTQRQLLLLMVISLIPFAAIGQWGYTGFVLCYGLACLLTMAWGFYRYSLGIVLAGAMFFAFGYLLLLPALICPRISPRRASCQNNLHNIALALLQYQDVNGSFPPAYIADDQGKPMHSWRVLLLPYLDQRNLYKQYRFDEPWDGPNNRPLHDVILKIYSCPSQPASQPRTATSYVVVVGSKTMWPGEEAIKIADVKDGASNTIMVVEVHSSGIHWMEPNDFRVDQMSAAVSPARGQGISSGHEHGANVAFADGSVRFLTDKTSPAMLRAALTRSGGEKIDPD